MFANPYLASDEYQDREKISLMAYVAKNHWLKSGTAILLVVGFSLWTYIDRQGSGINTIRLQKTLRRLDEWNPEADAQNRMANGDYRFAACLGSPPGPCFPGIPEDDWDELRKKRRRFWIIGGTSDAIESSRHRRLNQRAWSYAKRYNARLLLR